MNTFESALRNEYMLVHTAQKIIATTPDYSFMLSHNVTSLPQTENSGAEKGYIALLVISLLVYFGLLILLVMAGIKSK